MNVSHVAAALFRLSERAATEAPATGGFAAVAETVPLVPYERVLRLSVASTPKLVGGYAVPSDERQLYVSIGERPDEEGTGRVLLRGSTAELLAQLREPDLAARVVALGWELMRACAWTEVMLTPRSETPNLLTDATITARRAEIAELLERSLRLPQGWQLTRSCPLPEPWPLPLTGTLWVYAAATRPSAASPTLFEHSAPLARVRFDLWSAPALLEPLTAGVEAAGTAAVVPLDPARLAEVRALPPMERLLAELAAGLGTPATTSRLAAHARFFSARAGWLLAALRGWHAGFFAWLDDAG